MAGRIILSCPNIHRSVCNIPITPTSNMKRLTTSAVASINSPTRANHHIKLAVIAESLRKSPFNGGLISSAIEISRESKPYMDITPVEIGDLPFVNIDLEVDKRFPEVVEEFRAKIL